MYVSLSLSRFHTCCHLISPWWQVLEDTRAHIHKKQLSKCVKIGSFKTGVCVFVGRPSCSCSLFSTQLLFHNPELVFKKQQSANNQAAICEKIINKESLNHLESVQFCFLLSCRALFLIFSEMFKQKMAGFPHIFVPGQMFSDWRQRHVDVWCLKQIWKTCFVSRWSAPDIYEPSHREYCW